MAARPWSSGRSGLAAWLAIAPPELIRVGAAYSAKIVCSNVFIAGRDPDEVLRVDVQAPGHWLLKYMTHRRRPRGKDGDGRAARALRQGHGGRARRSRLHHRSGRQCRPRPPMRRCRHWRPDRRRPMRLWPEGNSVAPSQDPAIAAILDDRQLTGPGMRAVVVVKNGRIVGERYAEGFSAETPLLGWSMTKSVTAAIIGTLVKDGKLALDQKQLFEPWKADGRAAISLADLMAMSSGPGVQRGLWRRHRCDAHALSRARHGGLRRGQAAGRPGRQGFQLFERHVADAVAAVAGCGRRRGAVLAADDAVRSRSA